jgi:plasmid stabilization system protein ParE
MYLDIIFSDEATDTFESIGLQIQARWGEKQLNEFRKRTYKVIDIIREFPLTFQAFRNIDNIRKAFIHKNCSMYYFVGDTYIEILFFWDNRQDPLFKE